MIQFQDVSLQKDDHSVLQTFSLLLEARRVAVIGHNGSGKSSFLRLINGIETDYEGSVYVDNIDVKTSPELILKKVGFVFQNPDSQIIYPLVREDLAFGLKNQGMSKHEIAEKVDAIAEQFKITHLLDRLAHNLSGGEKQLVALVSILIMSPDYILLDEPTTLLDLKNKNMIMRLLEELPQKIIMISHDLDLLEDFDLAIRFENGRLIDQGAPHDVIEQYKADSI